ncbi:alkaline phosphatase family protein [Silvibacterium dinghuense]|uniref:Alkaline phosphatase family protein n=1 Tax=Silvibacterium dinghuense TaxID=1560006 RepID=A0A4Q1SH28_9BACT|nr:alkaline phosphatase family protein [Silvibacterium dinghuense]RXS96861.1 alkaline phosphatase family protein [Silvibacterium dinghuense]GGG94237.1 alkaline phosphatase family protein [Silvibacterium dinghuense]
MAPTKRFFAVLVSAALSFTSAPLATASVADSRPAAETPSAYNAHPKLVVLVVLDQFRADYLERYRDDFKGRGFKLFLDHGANFLDCYYGYANTETAPGHSTIGTGAYTDGHGIGGNEWWDLARSKDHPVTSVEDERYALVGVPSGEKTTPGSSPRNLRASTFGDELRLDTLGSSSVYGVSLKDRAAILPAGAAANGAFWIDQASGRFITSTYYMAQLPEWAQTFDDSGRIDQARQEANAPQGGNFYNTVGATPAAVSYELDFAKALITGADLGKHDTTDVLTLSISSTDILGHRVGPDSPDQRAMVDAVDTDLDSFFSWLDKNVDGGLGNVWIALTADHGIAPVPAVAANFGLDAATINVQKLVADLNDALNLKFSPGEKIQYLLDHQSLPYLVLNPAAFDRAGINEQEAEDAVQKALPQAFADLTKPQELKAPATSKLPPTPALFRSFTRLQMAGGQLPPTPFGELIAHSYTPNGGWYVMVVADAFQMAQMAPGGTNHFTPYSYDRHVPLDFYGAPFAPGMYHGRVEPVDLAATLASLLGVNQPSASVGHILTQALKPVSAVTYPKPVPVRTRAVHRIHAAADKSSAEAKPAAAAQNQ